MELYDYEKKHLQYLRAHLGECAVLLKHNGAFPLAAPCRLAAFGNGLHRTVKGGTGSGEVNSRFFVNARQGLENAGFILNCDAWIEGYEAAYAQAKKAFLKAVKAQARAEHTLPMVACMGKVMPEPDYDLPLDLSADAAVYILSRISGEGSDREPVAGDILLTQTEIRDILALNAHYDKFMLVLNTGGPVDLTPVAQVGNILVLSQLGVQTGDALADILLGKQVPSGKLTTTWAAWEDYAPMAQFGDPHDTRYIEDIYVGYRYFDSVDKAPLFPFGHGCSYTRFRVQTQALSLEGSTVLAQVAVTNIGSYSGKEVVQIYVSAPQGDLNKPWQDLAAFAKTEALAPGSTQTLRLSFDLRELAAYHTPSSRFLLEQGDYLIRVGTSSAQTQIAALVRLAETVTVRQVRSCCGDADFTPWQPETPRALRIPQDVPVLQLAAEDVIPETVCYDPEEEILPQVRSLTDQQLILANVGAFNPSAGALSIIGNASSHVAGAAGETTGALADQGFPTLVMADGPAGIRVSRLFYRDEKGAHPVGQIGLPDSILEAMPGLLRGLMKLVFGSGKPPKGVEVREHYATALPIGTALAQSWNTAFAKGCGDIVGDEMARFGVHLWLAPALNIHRSIRCGRNFEYFSEDPLISGLMAAALTQGVQAHPGRGVTVKHYAANNQETNRYGNNSIVSQRALREIYLRGFGICVRQAAPISVMSSYNLLNGLHTAQNAPLCRDILRCEFGFRGLLMTDWVISLMTSKSDIHPAVEPGQVAAAGGDLFMPGCKGDAEKMQQDLAAGRLTRRQLEINASRLLRIAKELTEV